MKGIFFKHFDLRKWDIDFVDSVSNEFGHIRRRTFQTKRLRR